MRTRQVAAETVKPGDVMPHDGVVVTIRPRWDRITLVFKNGLRTFPNAQLVEIEDVRPDVNQGVPA